MDKRFYLEPHADEATPSPLGRILGPIVLGANDGLVSILGFVTGAYGAIENNLLVFLTGLIATVAAAISMGAGVFLLGRAEREFYLGERAREIREMKELPDVERDEIRQIYRAKGFSGQELERIVQKITSNDKVWLETMMLEELHLVKPTRGNEVRQGFATMASFVVAAAIPLFPYLIVKGILALVVSVVLTASTLFLAGAGKTVITGQSWTRGGLEMVLTGSIAAGVGYLVGLAIAPLTGGTIAL